jgi:drug/metabolite transporter (DMT)-like permease
MSESTESPDGFALLAFAGAVLLGGGNFLAVRFSNTELAPFWGAGLRFALAGLLFIVIVTVLKLPLPRGGQLRLTLLYGLFTFTFSYALMYWALVTVTAGMAAVILASVPLVTPLLAAVQRLEPLNRRALIGAIVALGGIVWMTVGPQGLIMPLAGLLAIAVAAFTVSQSVIIGKRVSANHPAATNAVGMTAGAATLMVISAVAGETWALPQEAQARWAVIYLVTFGSVGLFVLMLLVMRRWTASATAYSFVLFPVVTMLLEAWLADVPLTVRGLTGAVVVMAGVWFGALAPSVRSPLPPAGEVEVAPAR